MNCTNCYGKGKIPTTGSAMFWPDRFPNEFIPCPVCKELPKAIEPTAQAQADKGGI